MEKEYIKTLMEITMKESIKMIKSNNYEIIKLLN
jgi:hypothetical protein